MTSGGFSYLDCTKQGPRPTLANVVAVLEHDPLLAPTLPWYDQFLDRVMVGQPPREWTDIDDLNLTVDLQDRVGIKGLPSRIVSDGIRQYAHRRPRHIVRDWLEQLVWDTEPRIEHAFEDYWGVDCTEAQPCTYVRTISRNFFIGLIARVYRPGCQLDTMVVFEGAQGIGKTSALRILGGEHYALAHEAVTAKDFYQSLQGKWLIEIGELDAFGRAEVTKVKTAISTPVDRFRASYGRYAKDYPRQCVFAGTTNADDWGADTTGLRRFWPVQCGTMDLAGLKGARCQLLAEAVAAFKGGADWWVVPETAREVQGDRQVFDEIAQGVQTHLVGKFDISMYELFEAMKIPIERQDRSLQRRVGRILALDGWKRHKVRKGTQTLWRWRLE